MSDILRRFTDESVKCGVLNDSPTARSEKVIDRIWRERNHLQLRLNKMDELIALLEKNPQIEQILTLSREVL